MRARQLSRLALALLCVRTAAAEPTPPLHPTWTAEPPRLDGRLDEPAWEQALVVDDFLQRAPREGAPASERTEVRILYTSTDLYLGVRAFDQAAPRVRATVLRRDDFELTENDQFVVAIDSEGSGRAGYWFSTNPLGVRVDAQFFDEGAVWQGEWNGVWDCATQVDAAGWSAELRIPFSTLRLRPAGRNVMGLNLFRRLVRTNEQLFAPLIPLQYANGTPNVSVARKYAFEGLAPRRDLRLRPYALGRSAWGGPAAGSQASEADAGIDLSLGLTPSLVGTLTLNPDFALADVDDRQLNLTRFSLFYPEQREFFLEQGGLFAFGVPREVELFFSRRVGLADAGPGSVVRQLPFGAKLTGRVGRLDLGLLQVRASALDERPAQDVSVARLRYGFGRSSLGLLATRLAEGNARYPSIGVDGIVYLHGETALSGFAAAADDPSLAGGRGAWNLALSRGGERQSFRLALTDVARGFDPPLAFDFKADVIPAGGVWRTMGTAERAYTGHAGGKITINIKEADDVERERLRVDMGEAHRTVIGHFRHEIGHYYWDMLVRGRHEAAFRSLFGDPDTPYQDALERYYRDGPPPDWQARHVSAYAAMHPWEDWAETFAFYLDMVSVLDTASNMAVAAPVPLEDLQSMIDRYRRLGVVVNEMNRDMGLKDLVPEVLTPGAIEKLAYVDRLVRGAGAGVSA